MLFDRVYRLLIGRKGEMRGIDINNLNPPALRITFDIQKSAKKDVNKSRISIWNLAPSTRARLEEPRGRVALYAGYREDAGPLLIFQGDVTYASTEIDGADISTNFELGDGYREIRDAVISKSYAPGVSSTEVVNDIAQSMNLPLTMPGDAPERMWEQGLSYSGSSRVFLDQVVTGAGMEWSIQNGSLQVIERGGVTTRQGILISDHSGMVGSPVRVRQAKVEKAGSKTEVVPSNESDTGWRVKCLLMPTLNPGDRVILESIVAEGVFRIQDLKHQGDSHGGDWQTELTLVDPNKPLKPAAKKGGKKGAAKPKAKAG
jgi:hypothetical protein